MKRSIVFVREIIFCNIVFYALSCFYAVTRGHKRKFQCAFLHQVFLVFIVIYFFVFSFQKPYSLWYKSSSSYIEVQVLTVVKGQVHMPSFIYRILSQFFGRSHRIKQILYSFSSALSCEIKAKLYCVVLLTLDRFNAFTLRYMCYDLLSTY